MSDYKREGNAITKALRAMADKARADGCRNPKLYFEPDSHTIYVLDGDHVDYQRDGAPDERQRAIVGMAVLGDIGAAFDAGAW